MGTRSQWSEVSCGSTGSGVADEVNAEDKLGTDGTSLEDGSAADETSIEDGSSLEEESSLAPTDSVEEAEAEETKEDKDEDAVSPPPHPESKAAVSTRAAARIPYRFILVTSWH